MQRPCSGHLEALEVVGGITDNPVLGDEAAQQLVDEVDAVEGQVTIAGN